MKLGVNVGRGRLVRHSPKKCRSFQYLEVFNYVYGFICKDVELQNR